MRLAVSLLGTALLLASAPALAEDGIGQATAVTTVVTGDTGGAQRELRSGDDIFQNELISTDAKGVGQFEFLDKTRLAVGPGSSLRLEEFVYRKDRTASSVAIELGKGAFRFMSGSSPSRVYRIHTATATLGVRGTAFELYVREDGEMAVAMINGGIEVCPRGRACRLHNVVGRFLHLAPNGVISIRNRWDGSFLGGLTFGEAMPFLGGRHALLPAFATTQNVASRYLAAVPAALLGGAMLPAVLPKALPKAVAPTKILPKLPRPKLRLPNPFR